MSSFDSDNLQPNFTKLSKLSFSYLDAYRKIKNKAKRLHDRKLISKYKTIFGEKEGRALHKFIDIKVTAASSFRATQ